MKVARFEHGRTAAVYKTDFWLCVINALQGFLLHDKFLVLCAKADLSVANDSHQRSIRGLNRRPFSLLPMLCVCAPKAWLAANPVLAQRVEGAFPIIVSCYHNLHGKFFCSPSSLFTQPIYRHVY